MHDPRVGRFFAVDPLAKDYPYLTPYQFSSNQPIHTSELEGMESKEEISIGQAATNVLAGFFFPLPPRLQNSPWKSPGAISGSMIRTSMALHYSLIADIYITKGAVTKELLKQVGIQVAFSAAEQYITKKEINPAKLIKDSFGSADVADAMIGVAIDKAGVDRVKFGKLIKAVEIITPSLIDITYKDNYQMAGINKEAKNIVSDIVVNYVTDKLWQTTTKFSDHDLTKRIMSYFTGRLEQAVKEINTVSATIENSKNKELEKSETKIDNTAVATPAVDKIKIKR